MPKAKISFSYITDSLQSNNVSNRHWIGRVRRCRNTARQSGADKPLSQARSARIVHTLRAGTDSARGAFTSPRPIHYRFPRVITVREAARLHSYPDWFRFHATKWHGFREIGNSVPPLLGRAVAGEIMKALARGAEKPEKPLLLGQGNESLLKFDMSEAAAYFGVPVNTIAQRTRSITRRDRVEKRQVEMPIG